MQTINNYAQIWRDRILPKVQKPARYIGGEWNQVNKDPGQVKSRVVLAFPDVYEIGISYLGYHILYELLNQSADVYAERAYSPWLDAEAIMRAEQIPLCSLETGTPLAQFHWLGITLQHELSFTNVLNLLDLSRIPILARERGGQDPLVIGGGPGAANPEPMAEAFDLIVLGDGEETFLKLIKREQELRHLPRQDRLRQLAQIPGVYGPAFYTPRYTAQGKLENVEHDPGMPFPVRRQIAAAPALPAKPVVPYLAATHDRVSAELFRGCSRGCRFCQAGMITRPVRERDPKEILEQMLSALKNTGYEEASFNSLSSGDYSQLVPLLSCLMQTLSQEQTALSFPSLRLDSFKRELAGMVKAVRKTGLTFAPEAGSPRLWRVINKCLDEEGLTANLGEVFAEGWDLVKLYFMVGLPTETLDDVAAISQLVGKILQAGRAKLGRQPRINLSINLFVPKPHTPFQWAGQLPRAEAKNRLGKLSRDLPKAAGFSFGKRAEEEMNRSYLEAVLARGDRRLWRAVHRVWELGARFDSWGDQFRFDLWERAFRECGLAPDEYAVRERGEDEILPWQHLDMGVGLDYLRSELARARAEIMTQDCRETRHCNVCGAQDPLECPEPLAAGLPAAVSLGAAKIRPEREAVRIRLSYQKTGDMRFVGHLDLVNLFRRAAKRAGLPIHYSVGFHPQPSLGFGPPLPLGLEGLSEWADLGLDAWQDPREIIQALNDKLPIGIRIKSGREVPLRTAALNEQVTGGEYQATFLPELGGYVQERIRVLLAQTQVMAEQRSKNGPVQVNLRPSILRLETMPEAAWQVSILHSTEGPKPAKISTILDYLRGPKCGEQEVRCVRTASGRVYDGKIVIP